MLGVSRSPPPKPLRCTVSSEEGAFCRNSPGTAAGLSRVGTLALLGLPGTLRGSVCSLYSPDFKAPSPDLQAGGVRGGLVPRGASRDK